VQDLGHAQEFAGGGVAQHRRRAGEQRGMDQMLDLTGRKARLERR